VDAGRQRAGEFALPRTSERFLDVVTGWLSRPMVR
jgi:hypothetical protein